MVSTMNPNFPTKKQRLREVRWLAQGHTPSSRAEFLITTSRLSQGWFSQCHITTVTGIQMPKCCFSAAFKRAIVLPSFSLFVTWHSLPVNHRPESLILSQYAHMYMGLPRKVQKSELAHVLCTVSRAWDGGLQTSRPCLACRGIWFGLHYTEYYF